MRRIRIFIYVLFLTVVYSFSLSAQNDFTIIIDAGHGGKDSGCVYNGGKEKNINLSVALKLREYIRVKYPNVNVLLTRNKDVFVGLQERADFANRHKADLFISIHVNSAPSSSAYGTETYVLGLQKQQNNLSVAMRENKAILLEDDYKTRYKGFDPSSAESYIMFQVMQDAYFNRSIEIASLIQSQYGNTRRYNRGVRQDALWVLSQSAMPSVLTEIGFLSNKTEAKFLLSNDGQQVLANSIGKAFGLYYEKYGRSVRPKPTGNISEETIAKVYNNTNESKVKSQEKDKAKTIYSTKTNKYTIKFMSVQKKISVKDKQFSKLGKGVRCVKQGKYYIYYVGSYANRTSANKALKTVRRYYRDAVVVDL